MTGIAGERNDDRRAGRLALWFGLPLPLAALALALCAAPKTASAQSFCQYEVTAIVPGPGCGIFINARLEFNSINDLGQACGVVHECAGGPGRWPIIWSEETGLVILQLPEGAIRGEAIDINNVTGKDGLGQIACTLAVQVSETNVSERAFLYDDGVWTHLETVPGATVSRPTSINDNTEIVGEVLAPQRRAFHWANGVMTQLELPVGPNSVAAAVSETSSIVGWMGDAPSTSSQAYLYESGLVEEIPPIPRSVSMQATSINVRNTVVGHGEVRNKPQPIQSWMWRDGVLQQVIVSDAERTRARDINDAGQVLVRTDIPGGGFIWQHGDATNLVDLYIPHEGLNFNGNINAINNRGQMAGVGGFDGSTSGVILTPVDVPLGDVNLDCRVDEHDLMAVLNDWGMCPERGSCLCDMVTRETFRPPGDGRTDAADLAVVLGNWSPTSSKPFPQTRR